MLANQGVIGGARGPRLADRAAFPVAQLAQNLFPSLAFRSRWARSKDCKFSFARAAGPNGRNRNRSFSVCQNSWWSNGAPGGRAGRRLLLAGGRQIAHGRQSEAGGAEERRAGRSDHACAIGAFGPGPILPPNPFQLGRDYITTLSGRPLRGLGKAGFPWSYGWALPFDKVVIPSVQHEGGQQAHDLLQARSTATRRHAQTSGQGTGCRYLAYKHVQMRKTRYLSSAAPAFAGRIRPLSFVPELSSCPAVLSVGDAHVENFGLMARCR
jgi:hypothetical protein